MPRFSDSRQRAQACVLLSRRARLQLGIWPKSAESKFYYNVAFCASNDSPLQLCVEFARKQKTRHCIKSERPIQALEHGKISFAKKGLAAAQ
jgi:hypothetical protein